MKDNKNNKKDGKKLAVVFPGVGYHVDKPLLYYSKKIALQHGFEVLDVPYGGFEQGMRGDAAKMRRAFESALAQSEDILKSVKFEDYDTVLLLSKSVGTAVAAAYAAKRGIQTKNIFYTPVEESFSVMKDDGIVFHGTADPWIPEEVFEREIQRAGYPCERIEGGNHSLETGDVARDIGNLQRIMRISEEYIATL
ncbi:MAG: alpha/beta hydrolase [Lachnospiraceae bacterium]|nr:alpha/beta hydrolase [Lachnospiraceae bacterium]